MHFSNFLVASAITLAPAVYGYGVATVEIAYHEACSNGERPVTSVDRPESTVTTPDTCNQLPAKHSFEIDAYSFQATPITKDTTYSCHAVGIYTNDECVGIPLTVLPLWPGEEEAKSPCIRDDYFDKSVSVRLICEDGEREGHDEDEGEDDDEEHGALKHADDGEHEEEKDDDQKERKAEQPKGKDSLFSGLNL
ncbi:hypothetical protein BJY04DRAFT_220211 [Aspergillus karnatakaensis]|uniref:protein ccpA n=1 Tax=Aspergillus karnatakaensis TaxID=1810916 RepID=UPI003CCD7F22